LGLGWVLGWGGGVGTISEWTGGKEKEWVLELSSLPHKWPRTGGTREGKEGRGRSLHWLLRGENLENLGFAEILPFMGRAESVRRGSFVLERKWSQKVLQEVKGGKTTSQTSSPDWGDNIMGLAQGEHLQSGKGIWTDDQKGLL